MSRSSWMMALFILFVCGMAGMAILSIHKAQNPENYTVHRIVKWSGTETSGITLTIDNFGEWGNMTYPLYFTKKDAKRLAEIAAIYGEDFTRKLFIRIQWRDGCIYELIDQWDHRVRKLNPTDQPPPEELDA